MTAYATTVPAWTALTAYLVGGRVQPVTADQTVWAVKVAGTSGAVEPTWPTAEPWTVVDGTVTWQKGSSARRQMVQGLYTSLSGFKAANPSLLNDVAITRPGALSKLAMPAVYIGARDETIAQLGQLQERTFSGLQAVLVDIVPDNAQAEARADDLVDALVDWFSTRYHAASGFSLLMLSSVTQASEEDGGVPYLAQVFTFGPSSVTEGRS